MIGQAPSSTRVRVFGRYNAIAYLAGAVGALAAGGPTAFRGAFPSLPANQRFLLAFPVVAAVCVALSTKLSVTVERRRPVRAAGLGMDRQAERTGRRPQPPRSQRTIRRLAALFAVDSFGGGFIVQSFLVFWFHRKFGASAATM